MAGRRFGVLERQLPADFLRYRLLDFWCHRRRASSLGIGPGCRGFHSLSTTVQGWCKRGRGGTTRRSTGTTDRLPIPIPTPPARAREHTPTRKTRGCSSSAGRTLRTRVRDSSNAGRSGSKQHRGCNKSGVRTRGRGTTVAMGTKLMAVPADIEIAMTVVSITAPIPIMVSIMTPIVLVEATAACDAMVIVDTREMLWF